MPIFIGLQVGHRCGFSYLQSELGNSHFWARGYFVSTVGLDENIVRAYIRNQEEEDERYEQMKFAMG